MSKKKKIHSIVNEKKKRKEKIFESPIIPSFSFSDYRKKGRKGAAASFENS